MSSVKVLGLSMISASRGSWGLAGLWTREEAFVNRSSNGIRRVREEPNDSSPVSARFYNNKVFFGCLDPPDRPVSTNRYSGYFERTGRK